MSDTVSQIKERLNIIDVVAPYVELHKAGKNFKGKSPFSAEKTPSFYVSPDRGMYYCFSTSQGGDIFNFIQAMEGVDFKESLKILAEKAGVELIPEDPRKRSERDRYYSALEEATVFYSDKLQEEKEALEYLKDRGVLIETVAKWRIGFAPGPPSHGWREAKEFLEKKGYTKGELLKTGLIKTTSEGKEPFDVFRDRIVFPMSESSGRVVAFSGRILHPNDKSPKYVNTPETDLYKKSELLYGYDKAKTGIRNLNFSLIVEGQFDVVMCHQAGYANTVAVSGTALTNHHVKLLERLSDKVVLALDADRAGIAAMKKAADVMLSRGLDVKVAEMPLGKDPADIINENSTEFKKIIGKSVHVIEFLLHVLRREIADDRSFKLAAQKEIYPFVLLLSSRVDQDHFVEVLAKKTKVSIDAVKYELDKLREEKKYQTTPSGEYDVESSANKNSLLNKESNIPQKAYVYLLSATKVVDSDLAKKLEVELNEIVKISELSSPDESERAGVEFVLEQQFFVMPELAMVEEIVSKLNQLKDVLVKKEISQYRKLLIEAENDNNEVLVIKILKSIQKFESKLKEPSYKAESFLE